MSEPERAPTTLRTESGLSAEVSDRDGEQVLRVLDRGGRLLLEVRDDGTVSLSVPEGDLELRALRGRVRIDGADGVHVTGPHVTVETALLRQIVGVLETRAKRIVERAQDSYRDVEGVAHLKANQVRIAATQTFRALAERVRMRAKKDAKVQADKIYLG